MLISFFKAVMVYLRGFLRVAKSLSFVCSLRGSFVEKLRLHIFFFLHGSSCFERLEGEVLTGPRVFSQMTNR